MELHSTLPSHPVFEALPGVVNHGVLRSEEYRSVTEKSKVRMDLLMSASSSGMGSVSTGRSLGFYLSMFVSELCKQTSNISDHRVESVNLTEKLYIKL